WRCCGQVARAAPRMSSARWPMPPAGPSPPSRPCSTACSTRAPSTRAGTGAVTCIRRCCSARPGCSNRARACLRACSAVASRRSWPISASVAGSVPAISPNSSGWWPNSTTEGSLAMDADPLAMLWEATLASSAALLLVLAMRRPVRALLGASAAYALWLCVPVVVLAGLLPRGMDAPLALPVAWQVAPVGAVAALQPRAQWHWHQWLLPLWAAGVLVAMALQGWRQQRFQRGLGVVQRGDDGLYRSTSATAGLPAVIGLVRPRILLPADFDRRYTAQEKVLVIAHERLHVRRGDLLANALAALLGCLFWFNPLLPFAMRRFRLDQELACDGRVIARHPHARRQYGEAMLKTQVDPSLLPLGCHWQASHPLKERIDMLKRPIPSPLHWLASMLLALVVTAATGYLAWARS